MSHLVETMAYVGATPWHGLGHQLQAHQPLEVWAEAAGMNWQIEETDVMFRVGFHDLDPIKSFPEQKVLYRSDNKKPLSTVSKKYQVVQPSEILEFYRDLTQAGGYQLETAGVLKEGRKLWALARTGQSAVLAGGDEVRGYLLLATACDGTLATTAQFTSVRVVCNNTLQIAVGRNRGAVKVPHRSQFDPRTVKEELGIAISSWDSFMADMHQLSQRKVSQAETERFFQRVFTYQTLGKSGSQSSERTNERGFKAVMNLFEGNGRGATLESAAGTAWGLLNSVTEYVDHQQRARNPGNRLHSAWFGAGAVLKQKAWEAALDLA
jgi:phage/plasmid-like protein (TIGR03299 family)